MLVASLNALRSLVHTNFPDVTRLYVSKMPAAFVRPSFLFDLVNTRGTHLSKSATNTTITWQMIYFAPLDEKGIADSFDQLNALSTLESVTMQPSLEAPGGTIFNVLDVEVSMQDDEVSCVIRLDIDRTRWAQPEADLIMDIQHIQQIGDELLHQN